jgi:integrase
MGRLLAAKLTEFAPEDRALLSTYETALRNAGISTTIFSSRTRRGRAAESMGASSLGNRLGAARWFLRHLGLKGWRELTVDEQLDLLLPPLRNPFIVSRRAFVCWLGLTGRMPLAPALLDATQRRSPETIRWLEQGRVAWPDLMVQLAATSRQLGYSEATATSTCRAITLAAAYASKQPAQLTLDDLVALSDALKQRRADWRAASGPRSKGVEHQPLNPWTTGTVLYHAGLIPDPPDTHLIGRRAGLGFEERQLGFLRDRWPALHAVASRYLAHRSTIVRPHTVKQDAVALGSFFRWLTQHDPDVTALDQLDRRLHIEPYLRWALEEAGPGRRRGRDRWTLSTRYGRLDGLQRCFRLLALWGWPEAPPRSLFLPGDLPRLPDPLPKAFDDVEAARMVYLARSAHDPLERLIIELLASCGVRAGEARDLKLSDVVTFDGPADHPASQPWLRVPLGKLGNDRYVPIGPELHEALEAFLSAERSSRDWEGLSTPPVWTTYLLARKGRRVSAAYCNKVVQRVANRAGIVDAHAHRWRHTFATQAINRGMELAAIATLLGHTTLEMTMVYARIANPTLRREFERVSQQVQAFYTVVGDNPPELEAGVTLPAGLLGPSMVVTRRELEWRRLGNGWCTRRAYLDCRYELICERCVHFNTDRLFLPVLEAQHADAVRKGQQPRVAIFADLIASLNQPDGSVDQLHLVSGSQVADFSQPTSHPSVGGLA